MPRHQHLQPPYPKADIKKSEGRLELRMQVPVPNDIARRAEANVLDLRLAIAIQFYADNRIDHSDACRLAGLSPAAFNRELLSRAITIQQYPSPPARRGRSAS